MRTAPLVAIACGGTGGHLFPGLAVAEELVQQGCDILLLVSCKEVDQTAAKSARGMEVAAIPAVALQRGRAIAFLRGCWQSYRAVRKHFNNRPPDVVVAMGGFTSVAPILAAKSSGAATFLHESNFIPGRANRWLAPWVDQVFIGFSEAAARLSNRSVVVTGTPVRLEFQPLDSGACRQALGLHPEQPVLLIMGGSQGASGINELLISTLPMLSSEMPNLQFLHLSGTKDADKVQQAYVACQRKAIVHPFLEEMELVLGAATVAVSRSGASSLAEIAAMQLPAILVPYPSAADNHQFHNARAFVDTGAARMLDQRAATLQDLARLIRELVESPATQDTIRTALKRWHTPGAAKQIAEHIMKAIGEHRISDEVENPARPDLRRSQAGSPPPSPTHDSLARTLRRPAQPEPTRWGETLSSRDLPFGIANFGVRIFDVIGLDGVWTHPSARRPVWNV